MNGMVKVSIEIGEVYVFFYLHFPVISILSFFLTKIYFTYNIV